MTSEVRLNDDCKKLAELNPHRNPIELVDELCKRNEALEQVVAEKTSELEKKNRELTIETALERVRSRSLAMHTTADLSTVVYEMFTELVKLDAQLDRCLILIVNPENLSITWYLTGKEGLLSTNGFLVPNNPQPSHQAYLEGWRTKHKKWHYLLAAKEKRDWDAYGFTQTGLSQLPDFIKADMAAVETIHLTISSDNFGCLIASCLSPLSEAHAIIVDRFTTVFNQTYTRFLDLQKAEAQAREAQIEAALERVRSRTMGMQRSDELQDAALLLFQQIEGLGLPPFACGFNIWDDDRKAATAWMGSVGGLQPSFKTDSSRDVYLPIYEAAQRGESLFMIEQSGRELEIHYDYLATIPTFRDVILPGLKRNGISVPTFQIIHCAYFTQGYLMFISFEPVPAYYDVFKRFAKVFEQTYTRFLDLQKAEAQALRAEEDLIAIKAARQKAEEALAELKATQSQLIQSEKMASLGELTAGIAHEIQNPLNFVNNFSEVNTELIEEMKSELKAGNTEDAITLANDIAENESKINHHGKRADAIVKGMLQHSRTSSGVKEPTDINALADEYLRLAYHGLRAKDKSFNADFVTDLDETLPKINVIPQDIGRVILNLITNAFYAVNEKKQRFTNDLTGFQNLSGLNGYEPTVFISTKKMNETIEIKVGDNGNGIPQKALDKIFQPFFTTKPTGQGTGLGLSLSYDIVKAHGGEIKVNTKENEGTEFTIQLPL